MPLQSPSASTVSLEENPLYRAGYFPRFDEIEPSHVVPAMEQILEDCTSEIKRLESGVDRSWNALVRPIERIGQRLDESWSVVDHLLAVRDQGELRTAQREIQPKIVELSMRLGQSRKIFDQLVALREHEGSNFDSGQHRIIDAMIQDAELAGVALEGEKKTRFRAIRGELAELRTQFQNNVLDATKQFELWLETEDDAKGLPATLRRLAAQSARDAGRDQADPDKGPWRITLDYPLFGPFMEHSQRRDLREQIYRASIERAGSGEFNNRDLVKRALELRKEMAALLDFDDYGALSLARKMANSAGEIETFHDSIRQSARPKAANELEELRKLAADKNAPEAADFQRWDTAFWSERLREQRFGFTDEELRPYFALPRILDGLFGLVEELFGVTMEPAPDAGPIWNDDVELYAVKNESKETIAYFYLDAFSRPKEKRGGAWCGTCRNRSVDENGEVSLPIAYLICNQTPPVGDEPSLMTFGEVKTLFHEFGHGLQHMLTTVDHGLAAGIENIEWDAVELPSQFMENWCYVPEVLEQLARHFKTGESLPETLRDSLIAARNFRAATGLMAQISFGTIDLTIHGDFDARKQDPFEVQREIQEAHSSLPPLAEDSFLAAFSHIFAGGYAAGYYSYLWAKVLSADAFEAFEEAGLTDAKARQKTGRSFRNTVLALGGSEDPLVVFQKFRGREPKPDALIRQLGLES